MDRLCLYKGILKPLLHSASLLLSPLATMSSSSSLPHDVVRNRWLGFLIWQSIASAVANLPSSILLRSSSAAALLFSSLAFHFSLLLLSLGLFLVASPHPEPSASPADLAAALRSLLGSSFHPSSARRVRRALASVLFLLICGAAGFLSVAAICGVSQVGDGTGLVGVGLRGLVFGLVYGLHYVYRRRWILQFPIIQRPLFYSFKIGLPSSLKRSIRLSVQAYICSMIVMLLLPDQFKSKSTIGKYILQQIRLCIGTVTTAICWEMSHHLLQVVHTKRCIFAQPKGSAAADQNPCGTLVDALEQSDPRSLAQYLAYLDLCIVSDNNVEAWRRAAIFGGNGETYQAVINRCLKPLEHLTAKLAEGLQGSSLEKSDLLSKQLNASLGLRVDDKLHEAFVDIQICSWCATSLGALTARSHSEDKYGVAQLTGGNKAAVSILLSCLLALEACLGKKTSAQLAHLTSPAGIRWVTNSAGKRDEVPSTTNRRRDMLVQAYVMGDVLKTSLYRIVSAFEADMRGSAEASVLDNNWIKEGKPPYGTNDMLLQKLKLFLDYRA